jgi:SAM-dependent methyltransferase
MYSAIDHWFLRRVLGRRYGFSPSAAGIRPLADFGADGEGRNAYAPSPWGVLRRVVPSDEITSEDVFLDLGCGMGLVLLEAARLPFRRVIGVDVVPEFTAASRALLERNREILRCDDFELITDDAAHYEIPDDVTVLYLNDPFRGGVLDEVISRLLASVDRRRRSLRIVYLAPPWLSQLDQTPGLELIRLGRRGFRRWLKADYLRLYAVRPC